VCALLIFTAAVSLFASHILLLIVFVDSADETRKLPASPLTNLFPPYIQVLLSSRALYSRLLLVGGPMPFVALECLSAIINLGAVVRLVGCALLGGPMIKRRP
jgi:hypothetical protein